MSSTASKGRKWTIYLGAGALLCLLVVGFASTLLCWVTPSVLVVNESSKPLQSIVLSLPSNQLTFDDLQPGSRDRIFYDANQSDGVYQFTATLDGHAIQHSCGQVTHSEWGKRMLIKVTRDGEVECREKLRHKP